MADKEKGKQHPLPEWLKVPMRMRPDQLRQFRRFLKLIHQIEKRRKRAALGE